MGGAGDGLGALAEQQAAFSVRQHSLERVVEQLANDVGQMMHEMRSVRGAVEQHSEVRELLQYRRACALAMATPASAAADAVTLRTPERHSTPETAQGRGALRAVALRTEAEQPADGGLSAASGHRTRAGAHGSPYDSPVAHRPPRAMSPSIQLPELREFPRLTSPSPPLQRPQRPLITGAVASPSSPGYAQFGELRDEGMATANKQQLRQMIRSLQTSGQKPPLATRSNAATSPVGSAPAPRSPRSPPVRESRPSSVRNPLLRGSFERASVVCLVAGCGKFKVCAACQAYSVAPTHVGSWHMLSRCTALSEARSPLRHTRVSSACGLRLPAHRASSRRGQLRRRRAKRPTRGLKRTSRTSRTRQLRASGKRRVP